MHRKCVPNAINNNSEKSVKSESIVKVRWQVTSTEKVNIQRIRVKPYEIRSATMMSTIPLHGSLQHTLRAKSSNRQSAFLWALHHEINTIQFKMQISFEIIFCFYSGRTKSPVFSGTRFLVGRGARDRHMIPFR